MYYYTNMVNRSHKTRSTRDRSIPRIKPAVRAIEVFHAACTFFMSFGEILDLTAGALLFYIMGLEFRSRRDNEDRFFVNKNERFVRIIVL